MILLVAAPAAAADRSAATGQPAAPVQATQLRVARPMAPVRDTVIDGRAPASARISSFGEANRYPINDGSGATIAVETTVACEQTCTAADPQAIAGLVGTFIHGPEVTLLTVQLVTPFQLGFDCGFDAQACYYGSENRIVISGNEEAAPDRASRDFVLAHEYGHHVAQHRDLPAPFPAAIDFGPERWASAHGVCEGIREGNYFLGGEGGRYYEDPGEAFAESFAFNRFPDAAVRWAWAPSLRPNAVSRRALRIDVLRPWVGRRAYTISGRVPSRGAVVKTIPTPRDGMVSVGPVGDRGRGYEVTIHNGAGKLLRSSRQGVSFRHRLDYTVCGQPKLRIAVRPMGDPGRRFTLTVQRP